MTPPTTDLLDLDGSGQLSRTAPVEEVGRRTSAPGAAAEWLGHVAPSTGPWSEAGTTPGMRTPTVRNQP